MVNVVKRANRGNPFTQDSSINKGANQGNALSGGHATSPARQGHNQGNALRGGHATSPLRQGHNQGNALGKGHQTPVAQQGSNEGNALSGGPILWSIYRDLFDETTYDYPDPAVAFNFHLTISGLKVVEALFTECSGLKIKRKPHLYKEGGSNDFVHKFVDRTEYDDVKLKRGITASNYLWDWYLAGLDTSKVKKRNVTITLFNSLGNTLKQWHLINAFPIEWSGPDLKTDGSNIAFETITLTYDRLTFGG